MRGGRRWRARLSFGLGLLFACWGFVSGLAWAAAPFLSRDFGLDDAGVARLYACTGAAAIGTFLLTRRSDLDGRRRALRCASSLLPPALFATAMASSVVGYALAQVAAQACAGAVLRVLTVVVAEEGASARRATRQGWAGLAGSIGTGSALAGLGLWTSRGGDWRALWLWAAFASLAVLPFAFRLRETERWSRARTPKNAAESGLRGVLESRYARRLIGVTTSTALLGVGAVSTQTWSTYHAVQTLDLGSGTATLVVVLGGTLGTLGFVGGGILSDRCGRRRTFALTTVPAMLAFAVYYGGRAPAGPTAWLGLALVYGVATFLKNASQVAITSSVTELFPTRFRGTVQGGIAVSLAVGGVIANLGVGVLASYAGGIAPAVCVLALGSIGSVIVFAVTVPETAGLELEVASLEAGSEYGMQDLGRMGKRESR